MQEVEGFLNGTYDYTQLQGDTGPLVYVWYTIAQMTKNPQMEASYADTQPDLSTSILCSITSPRVAMNFALHSTYLLVSISSL